MVLVPDEQQLTSLVADALRAHDSSTASLLRMLKNSLHNAVIAQGSPLEEQARISLYRKEIKQRYESAEVFAANGRPEKAEQEQNEAIYIESLLPAVATREQIAEVARKIIQTRELQGQASKGIVIKEIKAELGANADGKMIAEVVGELL